MASVLPQLKVYKMKQKEGIVERVRRSISCYFCYFGFSRCRIPILSFVGHCLRRKRIWLSLQD